MGLFNYVPYLALILTLAGPTYAKDILPARILQSCVQLLGEKGPGAILAPLIPPRWRVGGGVLLADQMHENGDHTLYIFITSLTKIRRLRQKPLVVDPEQIVTVDIPVERYEAMMRTMRMSETVEVNLKVRQETVLYPDPRFLPVSAMQNLAVGDLIEISHRLFVVRGSRLRQNPNPPSRPKWPFFVLPPNTLKEYDLLEMEVAPALGVVANGRHKTLVLNDKNPIYIAEENLDFSGMLALGRVTLNEADQITAIDLVPEAETTDVQAYYRIEITNFARALSPHMSVSPELHSEP